MGVKLNESNTGTGFSSQSPDYYAPAKNFFGSDPEFFVVSKRHDTIYSPHRFHPVSLPFNYGHNSTYGGFYVDGEVKRDGPALEVNPVKATCRDNQVPFFFHALKMMDDLLKEEGLKSTHRLSGNSVHKLSRPSLKDAPEDVSEFGCNPDINAYAMEEKSPACPPKMLERFAGGHIHMSTTKGIDAVKAFYDSAEAQADAAIALDVLIGFPAVGVLGPKYAENERLRRHFYGQAGSYRINKDHGSLEYRVLSNTAFALSPVLMSMWLAVAKYFPFYNHKKVVEFLKDVDDKVGIAEIRDAINSHNYDFVWETYPSWVSAYPVDLHRMIPHNLAQMYDAAQNGTTWDDDILFNWGVGYDDFKAIDHAYWGHEGGFHGKLDTIIFPGRVTKEMQRMLNEFEFTNSGYDTDRSQVKLHPSIASKVELRAWERR